MGTPAQEAEASVPLLAARPESVQADIESASAAEEGTCSRVTAAPPAPACRICLQDDDPASLERPCSCSGSMAWAHHACIQRWIMEKHDKECEVCKQQFKGAFIDPPPRPPSAPLVAQLQVDNADNRIVLLADPHTGAIVARVVVPPGGQLPDAAFPWGGQSGEVDEEDEEDEEGGRRIACNPLLLLLLLVCMIGAFAWLANASQGGGPGAGGAQAGAWFVRIMLLSLWIYLRSMRPVVPRRRVTAEQRRITFADLEAGLQRRQAAAQPGTQPQ